MINASSLQPSPAVAAVDPAAFDAEAAAFAAAATAGFVEPAVLLSLSLRKWTRPAAGAAALLLLAEPALVARPAPIVFAVLNGVAAAPLLWALTRLGLTLILETPLVRAEAERERVCDRLTGDAQTAAARCWSQKIDDALEGDRHGDMLFRAVAWLQTELRLKRHGPGDGWRIEKQDQLIYVGLAGVVGVLVALLVMAAFSRGDTVAAAGSPIWAWRGLAVTAMVVGLILMGAVHALGDRLARRAGGLIAPLPEALVRAADPRPGREALLHNMLLRLNAFRDYPIHRGLPPELAP